MAPCDLYAVDLDAVPHELAAPLLCEEERRRAAAFHFEQDRRRWSAARAAVRMLIGRRRAISPEKVVFGIEPNGRPYLAGCEETVDFNISHAEGYALVGISAAGRVGVDIERHSRGQELEECREIFCSANELARLAALSGPEERLRELVRIWCAKEAYLKALGTGLDESLKRLTLDGTGKISPLFHIHFPPGLAKVGFCTAVALPGGQACREIEWLAFEP